MNRSTLILVLPFLLLMTACSGTRPPQSAKEAPVSAPESAPESDDESGPPLVADTPSASEEPELDDAVPVEPPAQAMSQVVLENAMKWKDVAHRLGSTVDELNALNGLKLAPHTVLAKGSEIYAPEPKPQT